MAANSQEVAGAIKFFYLRIRTIYYRITSGALQYRILNKIFLVKMIIVV